jgi:hypothetical protein
MRKIQVIPTIKNSFVCIVRHPKVVIPFGVVSVAAILVAVLLVDRVIEFFDFVMEPEEVVEFFNAMFGFVVMIFATVLIVFLALPFFEGWTYAALGAAFNNGPVSLAEAARKSGSRYIGMVIISIIIAVISMVVGFFVSLFSSVIMVFFMHDMQQSGVPVAGFFTMYGVMFLIIAVVTVILIYLKPAYMVGGKVLSESLKDGFETAKDNYLASLLIYLIFIGGQVLLYVAMWAALIPGSILHFEEVFYAENIDFISSITARLLPVGIVVVIVSFLLYVVYYAALTYAYMDSHEMID